MAPWIAAGLLSPELGVVVVLFVGLCTALLYVAAGSAQPQIGLARILGGYLGAITAVVIVTGLASLVFSLKWSEFIAGLVLFSYVACVALATVIAPVICSLSRHGCGSAWWAIAASLFAGFAAAVVLYLLRPHSVPEEKSIRLLFGLLLLISLVAITGIGFSLGARLPWTLRTRAG